MKQGVLEDYCPTYALSCRSIPYSSNSEHFSKKTNAKDVQLHGFAFHFEEAPTDLIWTDPSLALISAKETLVR